MMINLAANYSRGHAFLKDIAREEEISEKYLSQIVIPLRRAGFLSASRGVHGGYRLAYHPSRITAKDIVEVLEGDLCVLECARDEAACNRSGKCPSRDLWIALGDTISGFLSSITLEELAKSKNEKDQILLQYSI